MEADPFVSPMLHLDLYNFESTEAEGSRYVLTSPRSLEACARHGVRPVELLHKPLSEFVEENPDTPLRVITELYEVHEKGRRRKLRECREERLRIIAEAKDRRAPDSVAVCSLSQVKTSDGSGATKKQTPNGDWPVSVGKTISQRRDTADHLEMNGAVGYKEKKISKTDGKGIDFQVYTGKSYSLGDLTHSLETERTMEKLLREVRKDTSVSVPERDRKIAALMLAKHEEEKSRQQLRRTAEQAWEEGKKKEKLQKMRLEKQRRQQLGHNMEKWQRDLDFRKSRIKQEEEYLIQMRKREVEIQEEKWRKLAEEQESRRLGKLELTRYEAECKKRNQEEMLKEKDRLEQQTREMQSVVAQEKMFLASQSKLLREMRQRKKLQQENEHHKLKHQLLKREVDNQMKAEELLLKMALEKKLLKSQKNYKRLVAEKEKMVQEKAIREEKQTILAKIRAEKLEDEQRKHKTSLALEKDKKIQQALDSVDEKVRQKAMNARKVNQEKERSHHLLKQKLEEEEELHRLEVKGVIEKKDKKSEQILREKEATIEESRKVARASFQMREKVREQINSRSFDQMALEAQLRASLTRTKL
ncbi:coiled-coil domain-containing protein 177 [Polypterus senegalus]